MLIYISLEPAVSIKACFSSEYTIHILKSLTKNETGKKKKSECCFLKFSMQYIYFDAESGFYFPKQE